VTDYFNEARVLVGQVRGSGYGPIVVLGINGDVVKTRRGTNLLTESKGFRERQDPITWVRRMPVMGSVEAFEKIGSMYKGWVEVAPKWRWEHPLLGAVQKQRWCWDAIPPHDGDRVLRTRHDGTREHPGCRTECYRLLWERAMREQTLSILHRPRVGALAVPEAFAR
jgi:hypothetical protein